MTLRFLDENWSGLGDGAIDPDDPPLRPFINRLAAGGSWDGTGIWESDRDCLFNLQN